MNIKTVIGLGLAFGLVGAASAENTILATHGVAKGGASTLALDMQTAGGATAFQFLVNLPKGSRNVDVSKCLSDLPKTHTGKCVASKDGSKVAVVVFSAMNEPLNAGIHSLGEIRYLSPGNGQPGLEKVLVADGTGQGSLPSSAKVFAVDPGRSEGRRNESTR